MVVVVGRATVEEVECVTGTAAVVGVCRSVAFVVGVCDLVVGVEAGGCSDEGAGVEALYGTVFPA